MTRWLLDLCRIEVIICPNQEREVMKFFLIAAILLTASGFALAQEDIKAKHAAYARCVENIEKDPHKAFEYCSDYLSKYPNHDKQTFGHLGKFVAAYKKVAQYMKSVPSSDFAEITPRWAVYTPGLSATIPLENSQAGNYRVSIKRAYGSVDEEKLLAKAESVYKNPEGVDLELLKEWHYLGDEKVLLPDGEPKWWVGSSDRVLSTALVTTQAVLYYQNVSQTFRKNSGKLRENSYPFLSSELEYEASIKKMDAYERSGKSFKNVFVANMTLTWGQVCGTLCGTGFTRNKIVVMSANGDILEMFLDDPVNRASWIA